MASRKIEDLDPRFQPLVIKAMEAWNDPAQGMDIRITCTLRSIAEQDAVYAKGRTAPGEPCVHNGVTRMPGSCQAHPLGLSVTAARGGLSWHNYGLAIDVAPFLNDKPVWLYHKGGVWDRMAVIGKSIGMIWGGDWKNPDRPHFEWHPGYTSSGANGVRLANKNRLAGNSPIPLTA